ncbi:MAG TPA: CPBP family glutamic-type intramembrane protease [Thermoplasmata archaeon]|nr:CPBP family glutamic-type intramembrane protease [Thermoplasmata archaeon]HEV2428711.1 CPBP family glutamic-type intramembrane protease [Thermoplasmata archaeon]
MFDGNPIDGRTQPPPPGVGRYSLATAIALGSVLSQYVVPGAVPAVAPLYHDLVSALLLVYGLPILAFALLVGGAPISHGLDRLSAGGIEGLRWYGVFSLLAFLVSLVLLIALEGLDPSALDRLNAPNPALEAARSNPWFWIGFSFAIGALEETIFRGWVFGYWVARGSPRWLGHALWTSAAFAGVHLYYGTTYGVASLAIFPMLFLVGLGYAVAFRYSGGSLVAIALLHGAFDATSFLTLVSAPLAAALKFGVILAGLAIAAVVYRRHRRIVRPPQTPEGGGPPAPP